MYKKAYGFTIVELLIVIVVIGILAAISIVAYNGISNQANDSAVKNDLSNFAKLVSLHEAERGSYPTTLSQLSSQGPVSVSKSSYAPAFVEGSNYNFLYCYDNSTKQFALIARSKSGNYFQYRNGAVNSYTGAATVGVAAMCPNIGVTWLGDNRIWLLSLGTWQI